MGRYELIKDLDEEEDPSWKPQSPRLERRRSSSISRDLGVRDAIGNSHLNLGSSRRLTLLETAKLSLEFSMIWFVANYFTASCLQYTTVASSTILTSTSSMWTLIIGALVHVEHFTIKKFLGVLASLAGIVLISTVDMSGNNDENRGSFPHKTQGEIALGDAMAFISAILYGCYSVLMKKRMGDEGHVNMPLFFGLVGLFNVILLWPGFIILHFTGVETFELPPTGRILAIVLVSDSLCCDERDFKTLGGLLNSSHLFTLCASSTGLILTNVFIGQLYLIPHLGLLLGLRHNADLSAGCDSWLKHNNPALADRPNNLTVPILELHILVRSGDCLLILHLRQPRRG